MRLLRKINKGLILTIIVLVLLVTYCICVEKQRNADKTEIKKVCEKFINLADKYVVAPEKMQNTSQELSSANEEEIQKNLNNELKEIMINNPEAIEIQSSTIMEALKNGYTDKKMKIKNERTITKISNYEFDGNQVEVTFNSTLNVAYKYIDNGSEKEKTNTFNNSSELITLQKVDGKWKVVYSNLNYYDISDSAFQIIGTEIY